MDRERVLIDTSILIDHLRRGNKERTAFYRAAQHFDCVVSAITEFEFRVGSTTTNQDFVAALLDLTPTLPFDSLCVQAAADIYRDLKATNRLIALPDLFIAATAVANSLPLLTLNLSHFERVGALALLSPTTL
jgi:predicted nucleic acid-binding protein